MKTFLRNWISLSSWAVLSCDCGERPSISFWWHKLLAILRNIHKTYLWKDDDDDEEEGNNRGMILNFTSCKFSFEIRLQYHQTVHIPHDCIIISFLYSPVMTSRNDPSMKSQQKKERDEALKDYTWLSSRSARELKQI